MQTFTKISLKSLQTSFEIAHLVAKSKKPHTIAENLIIPAAVKIAEIMFDKKEVDIIKTIPCSNDTIKRRITDMAEDIIKQVNEKIIFKKQFALQLDESTDISNCAQLIVFIRYIDDNNVQGIQEQIYCCKEVNTRTTAEAIFNLLNVQIETNGLSWKWCVSVCTDGAASMFGRKSGLKSRIQCVNPSIKWDHCIIHREVLAAKQLNEDLNSILQISVKIVNLIKARSLNSRLFKVLCLDMGSEFTTLLLHTEIRWLSRGKVLNRLLKLKAEVAIFLREIKSDYAQYFENEIWICKLAYLCDIFDKHNELNLQLQGANSNIFRTRDKVNAFKKKILFWKKNVLSGNFTSFSQLIDFVQENEITLSESIKNTIATHLTNLELNFEQYFPSMDEEEYNKKLWVIDPFNDKFIEQAGISDILKEKLMELSVDTTLKMEEDVSVFWQKTKNEYSELRSAALTELLPFPSTYLCEVSFSVLTELKNKRRNRLCPENDIILACSNIKPRIDILVAAKQAHCSH